ncbi:hypothetical protein [Amphritea sp.]|uniref:hypothetical protein n=1 Tax=Amphritea sp. TaxID=1872502 RepID=UPI0025C0DBAB|nr:hypothetical protein [Amphritea sp.]
MSEVKHKTRFELIRSGTIICTVEPKMDFGTNNLKISTSSSINTFPTLSLQSFDSELNHAFISYSERDVVRLSVSNEVDEKYFTMFEGVFHRMNTKFTSDPPSLTLDIEAIHSFFMLSLFELSATKEFNSISFEEFVQDLMKVAEINVEVVIEPKIAAFIVKGMSRNTNAFRLFKEVCMLADASVSFNSNNTVNIESRSSKICSINAREMTTLTDKDIISLETKDKI